MQRTLIPRDLLHVLVGLAVVTVLYLATATALVSGGLLGLLLGSALLVVAWRVQVPALPMLRVIVGLFGIVTIVASLYSSAA